MQIKIYFDYLNNIENYVKLQLKNNRYNKKAAFQKEATFP
jgi:hypothetical protein